MDWELNVMKNADHRLLNLMGKIIYLCNKGSTHLFKFDRWCFSLQQSEEVVEQLVCLNSSSSVWQLLLHIFTVLCIIWVQCLCGISQLCLRAAPFEGDLFVHGGSWTSSPASAKPAWACLKVMSSVAGGSKTELSAEPLVLPAWKVSSVGASRWIRQFADFPLPL